MGNTTKENVKLIAPELSTVTDELFNLILTDVALEVSSASFGAKQEQAQRYLAAHYLTISVGSAESSASSGSVKKEKVGEVEIEYSDSLKDILSSIKATSRFDETKYGRQFESVKRTAILPFVVVTP